MRQLFAVLASIVAISIAGCGGGGSSNPVQPKYQPEIVNLTDSFSFQLTGVVDGSGSLSYVWHDTGTMASVDRSSSISAGTVTLTLRDNAGTQVYQGPLNGVTGSVASAAGVAGNWTVVVDFVNATGTINFRLQAQ